MAAMNYDTATLNKWYAKFTIMVKVAEKVKKIIPFFGTNNHKTHAINEGTIPLFTCDKCAMADWGCAHSCYALRVCFYSADALRCYVNNTVARRRDPKTYYEMAFAAAFSAGALLRLNESGDFENVAQFRAACAAAKKFPTVRCITYTHRRNVAKVIKKYAPKNLVCRYSAWVCAANREWAKENHIPMAMVAKDVNSAVKGNFTACPSQLREAENERRIADGLDPLPPWTCAACAAAGCGCANTKKNIVFKLH